MSRIKQLAYLCVLGSILLSLPGAAAAQPGAGWVNVTGNVGGPTWGAYGVTYMRAVPGSSEVIAGVSERGLWASADGGTRWRKLGGNEMKFRPCRIVFDPKDTSVFWVSGCYGDAPFKTEDGGKTFQRLGKLAHADGVAVDFTDPGARRSSWDCTNSRKASNDRATAGARGRRSATSCPLTATTAAIRSSSTGRPF